MSFGVKIGAPMEGETMLATMQRLRVAGQQVKLRRMGKFYWKRF